MTKSIIDPIKKPRGRPPADTEQLNFRVQRADLAALDSFCEELSKVEGEPVGRPEAIRRILRDWLIGSGYLKSHEGGDG
jgi:hypothetical protein